MQIQTAKRERTRSGLITAVRDEIEASGGFTADTVARRAGNSPATFFKHFDSKEQAFEAAFTALLDDLLQLLENGMRIDIVLEQGLSAFARDWVWGCIRFFRDNRVLFGAAQSKLQSDETILLSYQACETKAIEHCSRFIRLGQAASLFRQGDALAMAQAMIVTSQGYNNPAALALSPGDSLHRELGRALVLLLAAKPENVMQEIGV